MLHRMSMRRKWFSTSSADALYPRLALTSENASSTESVDNALVHRLASW